MTNLTHFFMYLFISSLHVSSITMLIIRRSNCINTSSGMITLCKGLLGMPVRREFCQNFQHSQIFSDIVPICLSVYNIIHSILPTKACFCISHYQRCITLNFIAVIYFRLIVRCNICWRMDSQGRFKFHGHLGDQS